MVVYRQNTEIWHKQVSKSVSSPPLQASVRGADLLFLCVSATVLSVQLYRCSKGRCNPLCSCVTFEALMRASTNHSLVDWAACLRLGLNTQSSAWEVSSSTITPPDSLTWPAYWLHLLSPETKTSIYCRPDFSVCTEGGQIDIYYLHDSIFPESSPGLAIIRAAMSLDFSR